MEIYTLTLSPAYDIHASADTLALGRENLLTVLSREAGGKGVNISRALKATGIPSHAVVLLGRDNCESYKRELDGSGIDTHYYETDGEIRENLTVHTPAGETRLSFRGFTASEDILAQIKNDIKFDTGDVLTLTGRLPDGIDKAEIKAFLRELREMGVLTVIDSRSFELCDIYECRPWLIKPNREEISAYLSQDVATLKDAAEAASNIQKDGIECVMISLGDAGAVLATGDGVLTARAPRIDAVSTIGAGDSAIAGFIAARRRGDGDAEALRLAVAFGSAACLTEGSRPPRAEDISDLYEKIKII